MEEGEKSCMFNVRGCVFSIPLKTLASFHDSLLMESVRVHGHYSTLFIDRDGFTFRHVFHYISTGQLPPECVSEVNILHELAGCLHLPTLQQTLESLLEVTHSWEISASVSTPEPEHSAESMAPSTVHTQVIPQGLVSTPLVADMKDVLYCFVPVDHVRLHPGLINNNNLLWLCEDVAIIESNFLHSGRVLLPHQFNTYGELCDEARMVGMTEFIDTLQELSDWKEGCSSSDSFSEGEMCIGAEPLFVLSLSLLKYPDSSLGQLCVDSNLEGSRLYITGTGVLFQHVENWLGTSRLPLTRTSEELPRLCAYLDNQDDVYLAIKEAMHVLFHRREISYVNAKSRAASVSTFTHYKVVKVYAGTQWYATYFKTLIKHPELLSNSTKSKWIVFGESLLVKGDGQIFRHILNFLRCGRLLLPVDFREWLLLCQEIEDFQIPALSTALQSSSDYRAWCKGRIQPKTLFTSCEDENIVLDISLDNEQPHMASFARKDGSGFAFAYFSMSYEEMVYARECHDFLTGTILDYRRFNLMDCAVHRLWTGHMKEHDFVQELLTVIKVRPHKRQDKQEKLLQWVKFTLPLAQRYTECLRVLLSTPSTLFLQTSWKSPNQHK